MRNVPALVAVLAGLAIVAACGDDLPKSEFPTGDPLVAFHTMDKSVPAETAKRVLDRVLTAVPQLKELRAADAAQAGGQVVLNISLQSGPDPEGMHALERECHFVYVNTNGPNGLIHTATFVVKADLSEVQVFDDTGDAVEPVDVWLKARGLK